MQFLLNGKVPVVRIAGREVNLLVLAAATVVGMLSIYFVRKYTLETVISSLSAMAMLPQAVARVKSSWVGEGRPGLTPMKIYATCVEQTDKPSVLSDLLDGTFPLDVKLPGGLVGSLIVSLLNSSAIKATVSVAVDGTSFTSKLTVAGNIGGKDFSSDLFSETVPEAGWEAFVSGIFGATSVTEVVTLSTTPATPPAPATTNGATS